MTEIRRLLMMPIGLLCEYMEEPLTIGCHSPRFFWRMEADGRRGAAQSAYRIQVAKGHPELLDGGPLVWDSQKVICGEDSSTSLKGPGISYAGVALESGQDYYWRVQIWDEHNNESPFSSTARFGTALFEVEDWQAQWLISPQMSAAAPLFRTEFSLDKSIAAARIFVCGLGYYELSINGVKVGDHVLDPAWTDYRKRALYAVYDIATFLRQGDNALGLMLGAGWLDFTRNSWDKKQMMIVQLDILHQDGSHTRISSQRNTWLTSNTGPIRQHLLYQGEIYDARMEMLGWNEPGYDVGSTEVWQKPLIGEPPGGQLVPQSMEPIRVVQELKSQTLSTPLPGVYVFDLGQNITGWARLRVHGESGASVILRYAEMLYENGTVNQENLRGLDVADTYILKGADTEIYEPRFTYHGFRYVQVEFTGETPSIEDLVGRVVHTDVPLIGSFTCGNEMLNQLHRNIVWTERNNLQGLPTDCPQRDERLGWLNDMTVRAEAALYNFRLPRLYGKWIDDIADAQGPQTGAITDTAPFVRYGNQPADPVSSSYLIVPWLVYVHYGDKRLLEQHYGGLKRWVDYLSQVADNYLVSYSYFGDWAPPVQQENGMGFKEGPVSKDTPGSLMSSGYYFYNALLLSQIAGILNHTEDQQYYDQLAGHIQSAFNEEFWNEELSCYASGSQSAQAFPLYLGITPPDKQEGALTCLLENIRSRDTHLSTGNLCTKYLMEVLTSHGHKETAYALATQVSYPSWGFMLANGATTVWERWEHVTSGDLIGMASHNHPMYGAVDAWFYRMLAGISPDPLHPGYGKVKIAPVIIRDLHYVKASLMTIRGTVMSHWVISDCDTVKLQVEIPPTASGIVTIPLHPDDGQVTEGGKSIWQDSRFIPGTQGVISAESSKDFITFEVESGHYQFEWKLS